MPYGEADGSSLETGPVFTVGRWELGGRRKPSATPRGGIDHQYRGYDHGKQHTQTHEKLWQAHATAP